MIVFFRGTARKTKCDGLQPTCSSCARRSLQCNYVHDNNANGNNAKKTSRRASTSVAKTLASEAAASAMPPVTTNPMPRLAPPPIEEDYPPPPSRGGRDSKLDSTIDSKRAMDFPADLGRPLKKMRLDDGGASGGPPSLPSIP